MKSEWYPVGITACSNGMKRSAVERMENLQEVLKDMGIKTKFSQHLYETEEGRSSSAKERAEALMSFYKNPEIRQIFDVSGGDLANGILSYLDYEVIAESSATFWGYSDLTTVLNAIYTKTGKASVLYQVRNLLYDHGEEQRKRLYGAIWEEGNELFDLTYRWIQGKKMQGIVVGGNIRCFLKLAGTEYFPDLNGKILLLESYGGKPYQIETYLRQLQQLGAFKKISGLLLGTFTQMENEQCIPTVETLVKEVTGETLPIAVTREIGHGTDAKGIRIGSLLSFE